VADISLVGSIQAIAPAKAVSERDPTIRAVEKAPEEGENHTEINARPVPSSDPAEEQAIAKRGGLIDLRA